jgi:pimeloyl-ACP methyl ester carboxylesterase
VPADVLARLDALLAAGRSAELLDTMYRDLVHMSDEEVDAIRSAPTWPDRLAAAVTVPREIRAFCEQEFDPAQAALIRVPVLLLVGGDSPAEVRGEPETVAAAIPDARIAELAGQMHMAHLTDPEQFARTLLGFLGE